MIDRRLFLRGALGLIAAPAIVRVASLMPVKAFAAPSFSVPTWRKLYGGTDILGALDPDKLAQVIKMFNETNAILEDMEWIESVTYTEWDRTTAAAIARHRIAG